MSSNECEEDGGDEIVVDIDRINQTLEKYGRVYKEENEDETSDDESDYEDYGEDEEDTRHTGVNRNDPSTSAAGIDFDSNIVDLDYCFSDNPLEKCLFLNRTYQDAIMNSIRELENLLIKNRERQEVIQEDLKVTNDGTKKCTNGRVINTRRITVPYFKDIYGLIPPPNEDVTLKILNDELPNRVRFPRLWSDQDKARLVSAVERSALDLHMKPLLSRKEILTMELDDEVLVKKLPPKVVEAKQKEIEGKEQQIELLKSRKPSSLIGPREQDYDWMKISVIDFNGDRSPRDCELYWKNYLHKSINKSPWSKVETERLRSLVQEHGTRNWDIVSTSLDRTPFLCAKQYFSHADNRRKWTAEENQDLLNAVEVCRVGDYIPWHQVSYFIEGRMASQVRAHWDSNLDPSIRKGRWTEEEDILLLTGIFLYGTKHWWKVKDYVKNRTGPQCCERWRNTLDPSLDISEFTPEEDKRLLELVKSHGKKWSRIGEELGRTDNRCLTRWKSLCKNAVGHQTSTLAKPQLVCYRNNVYKNFVGRLLEVQDGEILDTKSVISRSQLMKSLTRLSNKDYVLSPGEEKLGQLLRQFKVTDIRDVMKYRPSRTLAALTLVDRLLNEYFMLTASRKPPGRPPKIKIVEEDDPSYVSAVDKFENILSDCRTVRLVPLLPPLTVTMQAFRNMLMMRRRLIKKNEKVVQVAKRPRLDAEEEEDEEMEEAFSNPFLSDSRHKDCYAELFMQFLPIFAWPAILSATKPPPEPIKPPRPPSKFRGRKKQAKEQKDPTFQCYAKVNDTNSTLDDVDSVKAKGKNKGRPPGKQSQSMVSFAPSRRSSRLNKMAD